MLIDIFVGFNFNSKDSENADVEDKSELYLQYLIADRQTSNINK